MSKSKSRKKKSPKRVLGIPDLEHTKTAVLNSLTSVSPVFRAINKAGRICGDGMSPKVLWDVVRAAAARAGIDKLAPHDLRRTVPVCAILLAANRIRSSSCSATSPSRRRSATLDASRSFESP